MNTDGPGILSSPRKPVLLALVATALLSLAVLGCGGDSSDGESGDGPEPTRAVGEAPTATLEPSGESPTTAPEPTQEPEATAESSDDAAWTRLPALDSYRYSFKLEGTAGLIAEISGAGLPSGVDPESGTLTFTVEGAYINPDRGEATITIGDESLTKIVIGTQVWDDVGTGFIGPQQLAGAGESDYSFVSAFWDTEPDELLEDLTCESSTESVNGVETRRCSADSETIERLNDEGLLFTSGILDLEEWEEATAVFWFSEGNKVIRFRARMAGTDTSGREVEFSMEADITDINAEFEIEPPS